MPPISQEMFGHNTCKEIYKNLGTRFEVQKVLPYGDIISDAWKGTFQVNQALALLTNRQVATGRQLILLFLRVWTQDPNGAVFAIQQVGGTSHGLPQGYRDYPMLASAGETVLQGCMEAPLHVFEGSVNFWMQNAKASRYESGISWWGVEPQEYSFT